MVCFGIGSDKGCSRQLTQFLHPKVYNPTMKLVSHVAGLVLAVGISAHGQDAPKYASIDDLFKTAEKTTLCDLVSQPQRFHWKAVTVQAREYISWEGAGLSDPNCNSGKGAAIDALFPVQVPRLPEQFRNLAVVETDYEEDKITRNLGLVVCNGMRTKCNVDYFEGEFTGLAIKTPESIELLMLRRTKLRPHLIASPPALVYWEAEFSATPPVPNWRIFVAARPPD